MNTLRQGWTGSDVTTWQTFLNTQGAGLVVDGKFGTGTDSATRAFQAQHGLAVDGVVGPATWAAAGFQPAPTLLNLPGLKARLTKEPIFGRALVELAQSLQLNPDYLAAVMSVESGVKPDAVNPTTNATGLIQFMPSTAVSLGTTVQDLKGMSALEQLAFVGKYFQRVRSAMRPDVPGDYYLAVFMPAFVGKDPSTVIARKGERVYDQNAGLDKDHDGVLTVADTTAHIEGAIAAARALPPLPVPPPPAPAPAVKKNSPSPSSPSPASASSPSSSGAPSASKGGAK